MTKNIDDETLKLIESMTMENLSDKWDFDKIFKMDFKEFDSFRIQNAFHKADYTKNPNNFSTSLKHELFDNSHLFAVNEKIKFSLINHKPIKLKEDDFYGLPFDNIFIDVVLKTDDDIMFGLHIFFPVSDMVKHIFPNAKDYLFISTVQRKGNELDYLGNVGYIFHIKKGIMSDKIKKKRNLSPIEKMMEKVIFNLILFFNEPRITITIHEHNNERRIKKGKIPIPSQIITILHYDLENYIEKIYLNGTSQNHIDFAYWVRGHKRKLVSPRYVNKQGQTIWIKPHLVGEGLIPPHVHKIVN